MKTLEEHELMQRCLELARGGAGKVSPNPLVGCVIVRNTRIVGEGYHQHFGGPHAEIIALLHAGKKARGATLYTNLEPCAHFGKTPPCVDAIIHSGISKVVVAMKDPNPIVRGKGIRILREAGIHVRCGVIQREAERLNEKYVRFMKTGMPFVGIKAAQTLDGYIADVLGKSKWITSKEARLETHRLRSEYDAILVGANTVIKDNPVLTVRLVQGRNPIRVVVDDQLSIPLSREIFNTTNVPTWVFTSKSATRARGQKVRALARRGVRVFEITSTPVLESEKILHALSLEGISSVLIEGGSETISGFVSQGLADRLHLFVAPRILGGGLKTFQFHQTRLLRTSIDLRSIHLSLIGKDMFIEANFIHKF